MKGWTCICLFGGCGTTISCWRRQGLRTLVRSCSVDTGYRGDISFAIIIGCVSVMVSLLYWSSSVLLILCPALFCCMGRALLSDGFGRRSIDRLTTLRLLCPGMRSRGALINTGMSLMLYVAAGPRGMYACILLTAPACREA